MEDYSRIPIGTAGDCQVEFDGYACTLDKGHTGPHAAHGYPDDDRPLVVWDDIGYLYEAD